MALGDSFEDGQAGGQDLLKLFADLGYTQPPPPASPDRVASVVQALWSRSSTGEPHPAVLGFFSEVMPESSFHGNILCLWGLEQMRSDQDQVAPVCNIAPGSGLFAFAEWTGESDGDAWCYDIEHEVIRCIPVSCGYEDADQTRLSSYGVFPYFQHMAGYLRIEAADRGWFSNE